MTSRSRRLGNSNNQLNYQQVTSKLQTSGNHGLICAKFFLGFMKKYLFITTCIEKHCTRPLKWKQNCNPVSSTSEKPVMDEWKILMCLVLS